MQVALENMDFRGGDCPQIIFQRKSQRIRIYLPFLLNSNIPTIISRCEKLKTVHFKMKIIHFNPFQNESQTHPIYFPFLIRCKKLKALHFKTKKSIISLML
jgi:hypothetical protein